MERFGIYVHIPFCKKKCKYCDFNSFFAENENIEKYVDKLKCEIENSIYQNKVVHTIYFGGGTPSFIDEKYIVDILGVICKKFNVLKDAEITLEINPGTITKEKLKTYKDAGINRISIGLQSTKRELLELIGRIHTYEDFEKTYDYAKEVGVENINVDLMLALPNQNLEDLKESLIKVINKNPNHISLYSLILEENTPLEKMVLENEISLPEEKEERKMYWETKKILEKNGYNHYEISNFAKKRF